jgi:hypothetical protein
MSGLPDIGALVRKSAKADLRGRVSNHVAAPSFETRAAPAPQDEADQYAYSSKIGSTEPFHGPRNFSSSSSAGVMPRAMLSSSGRK